MTDMKVFRNQKAVQEMLERSNNIELVRSLSDDELVDLINNTSDVKLLAVAEEEFVNREVASSEDSLEPDDIEKSILKSWRPR